MIANHPDLYGQRFNRLIALERIPGSRRVPVKWKCQCDCGALVTVRQSELTSGRTKSCGCFRLDQLRKKLPYNFVDMAGQKFGRLTVLERSSNKKGNTMWTCLCECGEVRVVDRGNLITGRQKSCGCHSRDLAISNHTSHGLSKTKLYKVWSWMLTRCYNPKALHYRHYGGRGITVCDQWRIDFVSFYNDMKDGYALGLQLDRIDVNGNYCKENCRWATPSQNGRNKRNSAYVIVNGNKKPLLDWAEEKGINRMTAYKRFWQGRDAAGIARKNFDKEKMLYLQQKHE